jgi:RNA polymerase sigma-70 factor (ECF subfamily)
MRAVLLRPDSTGAGASTDVAAVAEDKTAGGERDLPPEFIDAFRRGEDAGVRAVYARFAGPVYAAAHSVLHDHDLATEAVQETFVRAWRSAAKYDPRRGLAPWLYVIARRVAIDIHRSRRHLADGPPDDNAIVTLPPELDTIWEAFQVRAAVDQLPADERAVVRLSHFEQLSHPEIAARLDIPLGTVKSRSHRAHRRLADWLRPLCGNEETTIEPAVAYRHSDDAGAAR